MISSKQNKQFKQWLKLKQKKYRDQYDMFLVYGNHLVTIASQKGYLLEKLTSQQEENGTLVSLDLIEALSQTETIIEPIGVCKKINQSIKSQRILALEDVQDPSNVGALLRSASAFGFEKVIISLKTADIYNEKVIRASKGAIFDLDIERKPIKEALMQLKREGYQILIADAHQKHSAVQEKPLVIVLGNEGQGISADIKQLSDATLNIKTRNVESLNVSVAGAILMYQWSQL
jgi:RNA methyltransferase, TrmH family